MKKIFWMTLFGTASVALFGCPIYSDSGGGGTCAGDCPASNYCASDYDCQTGYACNQNGVCVPGSTSTHDGGQTTCGTNGVCPVGTTCELSGGTLSCVSTGDGGSSKVDGGADSGADTGTPFTGCQSAGDCTSLGAGAQCLDGTCVAAAQPLHRSAAVRRRRAVRAGHLHPLLQRREPVPDGLHLRHQRHVLRQRKPLRRRRRDLPHGADLRRAALREPLRRRRDLPQRAGLHRQRLHPEPDPELRLRHRRNAWRRREGRLRGGEHLPPPQLLHRLRPERRCRRLPDGRHVQSVQVGHDFDGHLQRLRLEHDARQPVRSDHRQGLHRGRQVCIDGYCH